MQVERVTFVVANVFSQNMHFFHSVRGATCGLWHILAQPNLNVMPHNTPIILSNTLLRRLLLPGYGYCLIKQLKRFLNMKYFMRDRKNHGKKKWLSNRIFSVFKRKQSILDGAYYPGAASIVSSDDSSRVERGAVYLHVVLTHGNHDYGSIKLQKG